MMKKSVVAVSLALAVGISNMAFAGFGIPGVPKAPKAAPAAQSSSESKTAAVDLSDITGKQQKVLKYMCGAQYAQLKALLQVKAAYEGLDDDEKAGLEAEAALKQHSNSNVKKVQSIINKTAEDVEVLAAKADKNKLNKAKLAAAIKSGKAYMQASYINYGVVTATLPGALSEASSAAKNLTKDPMALNKVNGAISTYKLAGSIAGESKKIIDKYDAMVASWKEADIITDADLNAAPAADAEAVANDCLNFVEGK